MSKQKLICVVGPTASGKTALSIALARELCGEIVSADSMQIYKGMDIGTAKPTVAERGEIPHHMIDIVSPEENYSAARYVHDASSVVDEIAARGHVPIAVGGTGLYIDSLVKGREFAAFEEDREYRNELRALYEREGAEFLHELLKKVDPERAASVHPNNVKRVIRALEVYKATRRTISEHDTSSAMLEPKYDAVYIGLMFSDREELYKRIDARVDKMIEDGLMKEVCALLDGGVSETATSLQAIGYKELVSVYRGERDISEAVSEIKRATRRYAKRQMTWFRKNDKIHWIDVSKTEKFYDILHTSRNFI